ncbi:MAG: hypothetical protein ACEQSD_01065 [Flavobacteriales bacterium]
MAQIDVSQLDQIPFDSMKIIDTRATAFDQNIKQLSCEGTLTMSNQLKLPIRYESQLDDNNKHLVIAKDFDVTLLSHPPFTPSSVIGEWEGQLTGYDGSMTVTQSGTGYQADLGVGGSGCGGSFTGRGELKGNILKLVDPTEDYSCVITVKFETNTAQVSEDNCMYYHGAGCGFDGTLTKLSNPPTAAVTQPSYSKPAQISMVEKLYADYPEEGSDSPLNLSVSEMAKLFTPSLVSLINADNKCAAEIQGICNLDFAILWESQDPTGAKTMISQGASPEQVKVAIDGDGDPRELIYKMQQTSSGWRIADIQYNHGSSLVEILSRK